LASRTRGARRAPVPNQAFGLGDRIIEAALDQFERALSQL
jgi:hypothetical protein